MTFESPAWLYILPIFLVGMGLLLYRTGKARQRFLEAFTSSHLASRLLVAYSPMMRVFKNSCLVLGIVFLVISLARPQWGFEYREVKSKGIDVLFALDASKSMLAEDIKPNRLERAKLAILDFVNQLEGDRVGLIAFAGGAFLQCPPTLDYNAFKLSLDAIDTTVIPEGGTDLAAAISEASSSFTKESAYKFLILITDGEDLEGSGLKRAMRAKEEGLKIYTVGVGTEEGELIPYVDSKGRRDYVRDEKGNLVKSKLDEKSLIRLAGATEGFYVPLGPTGEGLREIYDEALGSIPRQEISSKLQKIPLERFQWALAVALILLALEPLISTRKLSFYKQKRRQVLAPLSIFIVLFLLMNASAQASPQEAYRQYVAGHYDQAATLYTEASKEDPDDKRLDYNTGTSAYKAGDYGMAESAFRKALKHSDVSLQEKAFYNLGNTLFQEGEAHLASQKADETIKLWEEAVEHYQSALDLNADHYNAAYNFEYVKKRLEELKEQQEEQQQNQDQQNDEDQQQNEQQENQDSSQQDQQQEGSQSQENDSSESQQSQDQQSGQQNQESSQQDQQSGDQRDAQSGQESSSEGQQSKEQSAGQEQANNLGQGDEIEGAGDEQQEASAGSMEDREAMTRYEALKLLDSLKDSEKKLPINAFGSQQSPHENKPKKDW